MTPPVRRTSRGSRRPLAALALLALLVLGACIPARLRARPAVHGVVLAGDRPAAGVPLALSEQRADSGCTAAAARTVTDSSGAFAFPERRRWLVLPLLGVSDARFVWHVCAGMPPRAAYTASSFGGMTPPPADSVRCVADGLGAAAAVRCTSLRPRGAARAEGARAGVALVGVTVVPMTPGGAVLADRTVVVRDGRIAAIEPAATYAVPGDVQRVDARGRWLVPGLVDAHVHLEYFDDPAVLEQFVAAGVTSVRNTDGRPYLLEWRRRVAAGDLLGPTIHTAGPILDGDPPVRDDNTVVRTAAEARAAVAAQDSAGYDFVKVYTALAPEAWRAVLDEARARGLPVAGHVPRRVSLADALAAGQHVVEHLADFDELVEADDSPVRGRFDWSRLYLAVPADSARIVEAARRVAASGAWVVPTLLQADRALAPADSVRAWLAAPEMAAIPADGRALWERQTARTAARLDPADWRTVERGRANRRALVRALHAAGARVALGTDTPNPFVVPGTSVHDELALFVEAGVPPRDALAAATREAARLLGVLDSVGTIEVGMRADLLLLAADPLADVGAVRRPVGVVLRGAWIPAPVLDAMWARARRHD